MRLFFELFSLHFDLLGHWHELWLLRVGEFSSQNKDVAVVVN